MSADPPQVTALFEKPSGQALSSSLLPQGLPSLSLISLALLKASLRIEVTSVVYDDLSLNGECCPLRLHPFHENLQALS